MSVVDPPAPIELLPALVALLETGSVTAAAARVGVGQPAMSRSLALLRDVTGDALLVRAGRGMARTTRGAALLPAARAALDAANAVLRRPARFDPATARGVVTIALGDDLQAALAVPLLRRLRAEAPGLDVRMRPLSAASVDEGQRGVIDLAVTPDMRPFGTMPDVSDLVMRPVYRRRFLVGTRRRRRFTLPSYCAAEHVLVSPGGQEGGFVDDALAKVGARRRVAVAVPTFQAALALLQRSDLVSTLPEDVCRALAPKLFLQACPVETPVLTMCVLWAARMQSDERHRWLRRHVQEAVRSLAPAGMLVG